MKKKKLIIIIFCLSILAISLGALGAYFTVRYQLKNNNNSNLNTSIDNSTNNEKDYNYNYNFNNDDDENNNTNFDNENNSNKDDNNKENTNVNNNNESNNKNDNNEENSNGSDNKENKNEEVLQELKNYKFPVKNSSEKKKLKLLIIEINPTLTKGKVENRNCKGKRISECLGQDTEQVYSENIADIEYSSHGLIDIEIVDKIILDEFATHTKLFPLNNGKMSNKLDEDTWLDIYKDGWYNALDDERLKNMGDYTFDYNYIIEKYDLVKRRNNDEFNEVWIMGCEPARLYESLLVGKTAYWMNGPEIIKDCTNFKVMGLSSARPDTGLEGYGHATEGILNKVFNTTIPYEKNAVDVTEKNYQKLNLWQKFTLNDYINKNKNTGLSGVGAIHFSPNSEYDYDWRNNRKVLSKWEEWLNYPNLSNKVSERYFSPQVYLSESVSGTIADARLHHRWWFYLMPHKTGYTTDGYSNNWWDYIYQASYITKLEAFKNKYTYHLNEKLDNIKINITYNNEEKSSVVLDNYDANMSFGNSNLFKVNKEGKIIATKKGNTTLKYYRDGIFTSVNISII